MIRFRSINALIFKNIESKCIALPFVDNKTVPRYFCRHQSNWTFRTEYDKNPVKDPRRIRNSYSNFYYRDMHIAKTTSVYYVIFLFGTCVLLMIGKPFEWITSLEKKLGSKHLAEREERLLATVDDEPNVVKQFIVKAKSSTDVILNVDSENEGSDESSSAKKKAKVGFRDSRVIAYEDRIRSYSTPDKIFRYFATYQDVGGEIYMTPDDFVRSITPGVKQPEGLGLDSFKRIDVKKEVMKLDVSKDSVFYLFGDNALINFSDYVFLLTVICTPQRQFEIAFRMFDLNGDGELDVDEFNVVRSIIKFASPMGKRHRDNTVTGNTLNNDINSSLGKYFFGETGNKKLTIDQFIKFQHALQREIMSLEFNRYNPVNGLISEVDFADALLMYAGFTEHKKRKFLRRIRQKFDGANSKGITIEEYFAFSHFLRCISDVDTALTFYHLAGAAIDHKTLKHVCKAVANVNLSDQVLELVFTLFDENNDGQLSNREFIMVMKQRLLRGLDKPMDTGFIRLLSAMSKCAKNTILYDN